MSTPSKDLYKVLGVSEKASADEIRKAYRKLAKQYHPDANQGDPAASERFKEIGEAHSVLSNEEKRKKYDQMRRLGAFGFPGSGGAPGRTSSTSAPGTGGPESYSFEDLGGLGGLGDLFSTLFDRGRRAGGRRGPERGQDVEFQVEISFEMAVRGGKISIQVPITEECASCGGSGAAPGTQLVRCSECQGVGSVSFGQGGFAVNRPCPACMGRGRIPESPCGSCGGNGSVRQTRKLQVAVPEGVESGAKLRLSGQGERGSGGGEPGDLILTFKVKSHRFFRREGLDVHVTIPINVAQALLGSKIKVRTVEGKQVVLRIPPGTQSGTRFRIRGQGATKGGRTGDQFVEVRVEIPEELTEEQQARAREFAETTGLRY